MTTIYCTSGDADGIITGVGFTVDRYVTPDGDHSIFGDISRGYKRKVDVDLGDLEGILAGAGTIGYFTEAALAKPRTGSTVPLLLELIAAGSRHDAVVPPLVRNSVASIAGTAAPTLLSIDEQHTLFVRVLGKDWSKRVREFIAVRKAHKRK